MIYVSSIFRDSASYLHEYVRQVADLNDLEPVKVIVAEGDSTDSTYEKLVVALQEAGLEAIVLRHDHGGPKFGSVDESQRWRQIAAVCNAVVDRVATEIHADDTWLYVESDLHWCPASIVTFCDVAFVSGAVAAMSLAEANPERFYDTWGHVGADGVAFSPTAPYHQDLADGLQRLVPIQSAGSCFAVRGSLVPGLMFSDVDCIRGIGRTLREQDVQLLLDTETKVFHP